MITFTARMWALAEAGLKTQTRRTWKRRRAIQGSVHQVRSPGQFGPIVGRIRVLRVWQQLLADVTTDEARAEGFGSVAEFTEYLRGLHKLDPPDSDTPLWAVEFEVVKEQP